MEMSSGEDRRYMAWLGHLHLWCSRHGINKRQAVSILTEMPFIGKGLPDAETIESLLSFAEASMFCLRLQAELDDQGMQRQEVPTCQEIDLETPCGRSAVSCWTPGPLYLCATHDQQFAKKLKESQTITPDEVGELPPEWIEAPKQPEE